jgi:dienelactone hydrolase
VTVYIPDFFGGETLDPQAVLEGRWHDLDMAGFSARNSRSIREPEIFAAAKELRSNGFKKIGAIGFCFGGWAVLRLASVKEEGASLVDAIVCAHPSWVTNADFDDVDIPVMFLAPEHDSMFPDDMKEYAFKTLLAKKSVPFEWVHFPGVAHGCLTKGDSRVEGEREAMAKGKGLAVRWWGEWLG